MEYDRTLVKSSLSFIVILLVAISIQAFGAFQNMDFESASIAGYVPGSPLVPIDKALPGWKAFYGNDPANTVFYDNWSLGSGVISVNDTNMLLGFVPLDGYYSIGIEGFTGSASIAQTGQIPSDSLSVIFLFRNKQVGYFDVSFNGVMLPYSVIWSEPGFDICAADISSYAGQTGELRFTESYGGRAIIDDIQFSTQAVPEPGTFVLSVFGSLLLFWRCHSRTK
jgi:hypothetical protein